MIFDDNFRAAYSSARVGADSRRRDESRYFLVGGEALLEVDQNESWVFNWYLICELSVSTLRDSYFTMIGKKRGSGLCLVGRVI